MVRRRTFVWASETVTRRRARKRPRIIRRTTPSFYFAHRHPGDDYCQRYEQKRAGDLADRSLTVQGRNEVPDRLERFDRACSNKDREEDAGDRATRNHSRAEERSGANFRFLCDQRTRPEENRDS